MIILACVCELSIDVVLCDTSEDSNFHDLKPISFVVYTDCFCIANQMLPVNNVNLVI